MNETDIPKKPPATARPGSTYVQPDNQGERSVRNVRIFSFDVHVLERLFAGDYWVRVKGFLEGARVLAVNGDFVSNAVQVVVEHPDYPPVPYGMCAPITHELEIEIIRKPPVLGR